MHAQRRCRLPARVALAALLTAAGLAAASVGAVAAAGVTLTVHVGYQDVVKAGEWMPVTIDARNAGPGVDGTLEVQESLNGQPGVTGLPLYHESISLATGSSKRIRTYVTVDTTGATITARIVQNARVIVSKDAASASTTSTLIGVLSDQPTSLDGFAAVRHSRHRRLRDGQPHIGAEDGHQRLRPLRRRSFAWHRRRLAQDAGRAVPRDPADGHQWHGQRHHGPAGR